MPIFSKIKDRITSSKHTNRIVNRSKTTSFPGFRGIPLFDVVKFFFSQVKTVGIQERAAAIAFNLIMAIPPAIIFLFTLIPFLPISADFENNLYVLIRDVVPGEKDHDVLIKFLRDFMRNPRTGLLSLGFILSMFFSSNAMMGIMRAFNKNYHGLKKRTELQKRLTALKITGVMFVVVLVCVMLLAGQNAVLKWLGFNKTVRDIIVNARWLVIVLLFFSCISYIYRHAPAVHKKWKLINPGSILATVLMLILTILFTWWVGRFDSYNQVFGSIGTVLILMLLIFFNSIILLIGFELNVSISSLKKIADERKDSPADGSDKPK